MIKRPDLSHEIGRYQVMLSTEEVRAVKLHGMLVHEEGEAPAANTRVQFLARDSRGAWKSFHDAATDAEGRFETSEVWAGGEYLALLGDQEESGVEVTVSPPAADVPLRLVLPQPVSVMIRCLRDGKAAGRDTLLIRSGNAISSDRKFLPFIADHDGIIRCDLAPGFYYFSNARRIAGERRHMLRVRAGEPLQCTVEMR